VARYTHRLVAPTGVSAQELWRWHTRSGAFTRLAPPLGDLVCDRRDGIANGDRIEFHMKGPLGVPLKWEGVHEDYQEGVEFTDRMLRGAFRTWRHVHHIADEDGTGVLQDTIDYTLPLDPLGSVFGGWIVRRQLEDLFAHRHRTMYRDLGRQHGDQPMRIAVSGASGMVGTALCAFLEVGGHEVIRLVRK
jgi:ligand-binding SRPBCC domain-containing protein